MKKTSEDGFVQGMKFHLYGTSFSGIKVDEYTPLETMRTHNQQPLCGSAASGKTGISAWCGRSGKDAEIV